MLGSIGATLPNGPQEPADAEAQRAAEQEAQAREAALNQNAAAAAKDAIHASDVHFVRDPDTKMVAVQIRDSVTGDEIAQIPSDQMLKTMASIDKTIGLMLDKQG